MAPTAVKHRESGMAAVESGEDVAWEGRSRGSWLILGLF